MVLTKGTCHRNVGGEKCSIPVRVLESFSAGIPASFSPHPPPPTTHTYSHSLLTTTPSQWALCLLQALSPLSTTTRHSNLPMQPSHHSHHPTPMGTLLSPGIPPPPTTPTYLYSLITSQTTPTLWVLCFLQVFHLFQPPPTTPTYPCSLLTTTATPPLWVLCSRYSS